MLKPKISTFLIFIILILIFASVTIYLGFSYLTLKSKYASLQNNYEICQSIVNLNESMPVVYNFTQRGGGIFGFSTENPGGYIRVRVISSTLGNVTVSVFYRYHGENISQTFNVGRSGVVIVPVLPNNNTNVYVGNTVNYGTETISITYVY